LENLFLNQLSFHSHDANETGCGLPTGQKAVDGHMHRNLFGERRVHFQHPYETPFAGVCQCGLAAGFTCYQVDILAVV